MSSRLPGERIVVRRPRVFVTQPRKELPIHTPPLIAHFSDLIRDMAKLDKDELIFCLNEVRTQLHEISPFKAEPVDCVLWVKSDVVHGNDYNPNSVAPPEMHLLETSIEVDGYTQPIVTMQDEATYEVVDGFHRHLVGIHFKSVRQRVQGYLPVVTINDERKEKADRIAATIRHNRARGKHKVTAMSDIVVELKRRNWSNEKISKQLGMDEDEILRLCQITGLTELFTDQEFSKAWDVEGAVTVDDFVELTDDITTYEEEVADTRTVNTSDAARIFHTHEKWECYKAGFYATTKEGVTKDECEQAYKAFLSDTTKFGDTLAHIIVEWKNSCEHYLTNVAMNRIAWLGQAAACYALGIPSTFRGGFSLLTEAEQEAANLCALEYLNKWLIANNRPAVTMDEAYSGRQSDIY